LATIIKNAGSGWQQQKKTLKTKKKNTGGEIVDIEQHLFCFFDNFLFIILLKVLCQVIYKSVIYPP